MYASASIDTIGLTPEADGNADPSSTNRLRMSHVSPSGLQADMPGEPPIRAEPMMWNDPGCDWPAPQPHASASRMKPATPPFRPGSYATHFECDEKMRFAPIASATRAAPSTPRRMWPRSKSEKRHFTTGSPSRPTVTSPPSRSRRRTPTPPVYGSARMISGLRAPPRHGENESRMLGGIAPSSYFTP